MSRKVLLFAPCAFNLAETSRMVEIAKGVRHHAIASQVPALTINKMADLAVIRGGIGTVMTAALAGKPVGGVGMQMEQVANLAALERLGFAIRVPKSRDPSARVQDAIQRLLREERAKAKAASFAQSHCRMGRPENGD